MLCSPGVKLPRSTVPVPFVMLTVPIVLLSTITVTFPADSFPGTTTVMLVELPVPSISILIAAETLKSTVVVALLYLSSPR